MEAGMMGTNRSISLLLLIVAGTAGIAALFLPFTFETSPAAAVLELYPIGGLFWDSFLLAIPFFLSVLVSAASVRWIISGLLSRPERVIAYVVSTTIAFVPLYIIIFWIIDPSPSEVQHWLALVMPLLTLLFGVYAVVKNLRNKGPKEVSAVMAMQIVYLSNALLCLILFFGDWQIGAYFVVVTSIVYLLQIILASVKLGVFRRGGTNSIE
ncbi:MAG: hypothetical protein ACYTBV_16790 [Planctomycetota bacterium]|jgi:hypothetical protein